MNCINFIIFLLAETIYTETILKIGMFQRVVPRLQLGEAGIACKYYCTLGKHAEFKPL